MQISCKKYYCIAFLKHSWNSIYDGFDGNLPLQSYKYYRWLFISFYLSHRISRWRILFFLCEGKDNRLIFPLVINNRKRLIRGISNFGRLDYEDVVASKNDNSFLAEGIKSVLVKYPGYEIHVENVSENSLLYGLWGPKMKKLEKCVSIDLTDSYDKYISLLSKHQRQNIRTAYNKIQKEAWDIRLAQYDAHHPIPHDLWKKCQIMYEQRHGAVGSRWKIWKDRQLNPYTHILHSVEGWRVFVLFHDEEPISYMAGLYGDKQNCYYVPRLCINNQFSKYSPGIVLINEVVKVLIGEGVKYLDLMRGDEPYKTAMGGFVHNNYMLRCSVDELID